MTKKEFKDIIKHKSSIREDLRKLFDGKCNGDIFVEVRCRVYAFEQYMIFWERPAYEKQTDLLDDAYRFLYQSVDPDFIIFLSLDHDMDIMKYANTLLHQYDKDYDSKKEAK